MELIQYVLISLINLEKSAIYYHIIIRPLLNIYICVFALWKQVNIKTLKLNTN